MTESDEPQDAFHPVNFNKVMLIQMMRTYDVLMALLATTDPEKAGILAGMHEQGFTFCPNPSFTMEYNEDVPPSEDSGQD